MKTKIVDTYLEKLTDYKSTTIINDKSLTVLDKQYLIKMLSHEAGDEFFNKIRHKPINLQLQDLITEVKKTRIENQVNDYLENITYYESSAIIKSLNSLANPDYKEAFFKELSAEAWDVVNPQRDRTSNETALIEEVQKRRIAKQIAEGKMMYDKAMANDQHRVLEEYDAHLRRQDKLYQKEMLNYRENKSRAEAERQKHAADSRTKAMQTVSEEKLRRRDPDAKILAKKLLDDVSLGITPPAEPPTIPNRSKKPSPQRRRL